MKRFVLDFLRRGGVACGFGPIVLAIIYLVLGQLDVIETLTADEVCVGILSLAVLAFIAGGMNALYQIERLPLMVAILIHGGVLYLSYLATYLANDWLEWGVIPLVAFSAIFVVGFVVIWAVIYSIIKKNIAQINESLKKRQQG